MMTDISVVATQAKQALLLIETLYKYFQQRDNTSNESKSAHEQAPQAKQQAKMAAKGAQQQALIIGTLRAASKMTLRGFDSNEMKAAK